MVNYGASGACNACKQRRKKARERCSKGPHPQHADHICDETRPSCFRCSQAGRNCPGYELSKDRKFINYTGQAESGLLRPRTAARPADPLCQIPNSTQHGVLDWPCIEQDARLKFFDDYRILSSNTGLSRGYLNGLPAMVAKAGPTSELAQACTIIALANAGKRLRNDMYLDRAEDLYSLLLRSFRLSISNEAIFTTVESMITAALLGLYEVVTSTDAYPDAHVAHARGVSAILVSEFSPFDLICGGKLFQVASPILLEDLGVRNSSCPPLQYIRPTIKRFSVMCTPIFNQSSSTIDMIYSQTEPLLRRAGSLFGSEASHAQLRHLQLEAEELKEAYSAWPKTIPLEWTPRSVGAIASKGDAATPDVGYWPGTVTSYYDPYVASVWNSYRKASLLVLSIIIGCHCRINSYPDGRELEATIQNEAAELIGGIVSSIPYLLAADVQGFVENASTGSPPLVPGRPVAGLLSMHALYVLSTLPMAEAKLQAYIKNCLTWIGTYMGVGQATVLSKYTSLDQFVYATEARVIIWTGMLI